MKKNMIRFVLYLVASLLCALGFIGFLSPLPGGIIPLLIGLAMLVSLSPTLRQLLRRARTRSQRLNQQLHQVEHRLEKHIKVLAHALIDTRPELPVADKELVEFKPLD